MSYAAICPIKIFSPLFASLLISVVIAHGAEESNSDKPFAIGAGTEEAMDEHSVYDLSVGVERYFRQSELFEMGCIERWWIL